MKPQVKQYLLDIGIDPLTPGGAKIFEHLETVQNFHIDLQPAWWDMDPDRKAETLYNFLTTPGDPHTFNDSHTIESRLSYLVTAFRVAANQGTTKISVDNPSLAADDLETLIEFYKNGKQS